MSKITEKIEKFLNEGQPTLADEINNDFPFGKAGIDKLDGKKLGNWKLNTGDMSGTFEWVYKNSKGTVYATPFWEDEDGILIAVGDSDDNTLEISEFNIPGKKMNLNDSTNKKYNVVIGMEVTDDMQTNMATYLKIMEPILKSVEKTLDSIKW